MKTTAEKIEVMQHFEDGNEVERLVDFAGKKRWAYDPNPSWDWATDTWRKKPVSRAWYGTATPYGLSSCVANTKALARSMANPDEIVVKITEILPEDEDE